MAFGLIRVSFAAGLKHDGSRSTLRARTCAVDSSCTMADLDDGSFGSISLPTDHLRHEGVLSLLLFQEETDPPALHEVDNPYVYLTSCETHHEPRWPTEEINLASFVTRRPGMWHRRYFNEIGEEFFVDLD